MFLIAVVSVSVGGVIGVVTQYQRSKKQALESMEEWKVFFFDKQGAEFFMWHEDMKKYALYCALDPAIREEWQQELKIQHIDKAG